MTEATDDPRAVIPEDNVIIRTLVSRRLLRQIDEHAWRRGVNREGFLHLALVYFLDFLDDPHRKD